MNFPPSMASSSLFSSNFKTLGRVKMAARINSCHFVGIEMAPLGPIDGVSEPFRANTSFMKLTLGGEVCRTNQLRPYVFNVVPKAEKLMLAKEENKEYTPVEGLPAFNKATAQLLLGADNPILKHHKVATIQCCGGTGSLRLGVELIARFFAGARFLISSPTWGKHKDILNEVGVAFSEYRYYDHKTMGLDFEGMIADIKGAPNGSFILLQGCAHNPTCIDPTLAQWEKIADIIQEKKHIPFFDVAYQGFASGNLDTDVASVRLFAARGMDVLVAQSYSKNLGLYAERIGALNVICSSPDTAARVKSQLKWLAVGMYAFPPIHGARIVDTVIRDPDLFREWKEEIVMMVARARGVKEQLYMSLIAKDTSNKDWSFMLDQIGIFCNIGLNKAQREYMERKWHMCMSKDGRVSLAGLSSSAECEYAAKAIVDSFQSVLMMS